MLYSSIVRVCNTDVSHQNRIDDFYLAKFPNAFIELNTIRMAKHCDILLLKSIMMYGVK